MKRFVTFVSIAVLLGFSAAEDDFLNKEKLAKMACYIQKDLNVFDLTSLAKGAEDYEF